MRSIKEVLKIMKCVCVLLLFVYKIMIYEDLIILNISLLSFILFIFSSYHIIFSLSHYCRNLAYDGTAKPKQISQSVRLQGRKRVESPPTFIREKH